MSYLPCFLCHVKTSENCTVNDWLKISLIYSYIRIHGEKWLFFLFWKYLKEKWLLIIAWWGDLLKFNWEYRMNQYGWDEFLRRIMCDHRHWRLDHVDHQISRRNYFSSYLREEKKARTSFGSHNAINSPNESGWTLKVKPNAGCLPLFPLTA